MKIKDRFEKQNNSIRQLLKKLRRHDTVVVAISVLIALILCGGLIYLSTPVVASTAVEEYQENSKEDNELTREKLTEIRDYLTELDKVVCDSKEGIDSIYETTSEIRENNNKEINNNETHTSSESNLIKSTITEKMIGLDKSVIEIHNSIEKTNEKISEIEKMIISENQDNRKEIADGFAHVSEQLLTIKGQYTQLQESNLALSNELKKTITDGDKQINSNLSGRYSELVTKLDEMKGSMEAKDKESLEYFRNNLQTLAADIDGKFTELNNNVDNNFVNLSGNVDSGFLGVNSNLNSKVSELGENMGNKMDSMNSSMDSRFGSLEDNVNSYNETVVSKIDQQNDKIDSEISGLKTLLGDEIGSISSRLEEVFQSVSNGKKLLASTLLTKGVTVSSDASFYELSQAIASIDTTQIPGEVEYIRHYHVDGNGVQYDGEEIPADRKGGCFTVPATHKHNSSCYKKVKQYVYFTHENVIDKGVAHTVNDDEYHLYHCEYCGEDFKAPNPTHKEYTYDYSVIAERNGVLDETKDVDVPNCKFSAANGAYKPGCGYLNGQIIEARIKYKNDGSTDNGISNGSEGGQENADTGVLVPQLTPDTDMNTDDPGNGNDNGSDDGSGNDNNSGNDDNSGNDGNSDSGDQGALDTVIVPGIFYDVQD